MKEGTTSPIYARPSDGDNMNANLGLFFNRRLFLRLGLAAMLSWFALSSCAIEKENGQMTSDDLEQRGKQLRAEIELVYKELKTTKKLRTGIKGNDIGEIVRKYVPIGTSFDDAENILRFAGFKVYPRPAANAAGNRPDRYHVSAWIDPLDQGLTWNVQVIVSLKPKAPGDYSDVSEISAGIFYNSL